MANNDDNAGPPRKPQERYLAREITALSMAIDEVHQELGHLGDVSEDSRMQLQSQLATVIFQLRQWRDESQVDWHQATPFDGGPEALLERMLQGEVVEESVNTHGQASQRTQAAAQVPLMALYDSAADIMDICNDLGLAAEIDDSGGSIISEPIGEKSDELPPPLPDEEAVKEYERSNR
jgi:hypothetical protein